MTMSILGGNQHKAERIARDLVKNLTVADIEWTIVEAQTNTYHDRLCTAVDEDSPKNKRRIFQLEKILGKTVSEDIDKLIDEYGNLKDEVSYASQKASFQLGYAAALRLLGPTAKPKRKRAK